MVRRRAEETRQLLLDTALEMLHARGPTAGVGHIQLKDVVRRTDLTLGAAYPHWESQEAFRRELAVAAVRWRDRGSTVRTYEHIREALESGGPLYEVLRLGAEGNLQSFPRDIGFLTNLALRASAHGQPELMDASHARHQESMQAFGELYSTVFIRYGRRMKSPFTIDHLTLAFAALSEGFGLQTASGQDHPRVEMPAGPGVGTEWTLLGVSVVALIERMTEVVED